MMVKDTEGGMFVNEWDDMSWQSKPAPVIKSSNPAIEAELNREIERLRTMAGLNLPQQLANSTAQPIPNSLVALAQDVKGDVDMTPSEALIRAREACIAGQYVVGLDAETQVRAGQHDDWLPLQIAYQALTTKNIDIDVLRKYHAPGQLALAKAEARPLTVVKRERRSAWNILCIKLARWFGLRSNQPSLSRAFRQARYSSSLNYDMLMEKQQEQISNLMNRHNQLMDQRIKKIQSKEYSVSNDRYWD